MSALRALAAVWFAASSGAAWAGEEYAPPIERLLEGVRPPGLAMAEGDDLRDALGPTQGMVALRAELRSADWHRRRAAASRSARPGNVEAVPYLGAALLRLDEHPRVRVVAAMALGTIGFPAAVRYLIEGLRDPEIDVRFASALALGAGFEGSVSPLSKSLAEDSSWWVRSAAAIALGKSRKAFAVDALATAALGDRAWQVRLQAARSLGELRTNRAARALAGPLRDEDSGVRGVAAIALGEVGGDQALELVRAELQEDLDPFQRSMLHASLRKLVGSENRP